MFGLLIAHNLKQKAEAFLLHYRLEISRRGGNANDTTARMLGGSAAVGRGMDPPLVLSTVADVVLDMACLRSWPRTTPI